MMEYAANRIAFDPSLETAEGQEIDIEVERQEMDSWEIDQLARSGAAKRQVISEQRKLKGTSF